MQSKADAAPLLLFQNFDVMFAILYFSLNLDKGAWPRKILKLESHFHNSEVVHNAAQKETTKMTSYDPLEIYFVFENIATGHFP